MDDIPQLRDTDNPVSMATTVEHPPTNTAGGDLPPVSSQLKDPEIKDYGWNVPPNRIPAPVMHGVSNDELYILLRRFNKQIFHVKAISQPPTGSLDLEYSPNEEFSPDKLRATLERLYMTVIIGMASFWKHIARLRSWNEPWRTSWFCVIYYVAWFFNAILPLFFSTLLALILLPRSRKMLFPPAPLSAISAVSGNLQKPKAGAVGSDDSLSGAREKHQGEAVEQEARHFVSGFATIAITTAAGKGPGEDGNGDAIGGGEAEAQGVDKQTSGVDGSAPDPVGVVLGGVEAKDLASGDNATQDNAKKPVNEAMWNKARPVMQALEDICDGWERWANALSPTPPFPTRAPRMRIAAPLVPLILITYFIKAAIVVRVFSFILGFAFFGQPLITRGFHWLNDRIHNFREYLELRRTLLLGVPTNAQLTLTLLRIAEQQKAPLPPPPTSLDAPTAQDTTSDEDDSDIETDFSNYSIDSDQESVPTDNSSASSGAKKKAGQKVAGILKRAAKTGVAGVLGADKLKAAVGSENARRRKGAVTDPPLTDFSETVVSDPTEPGEEGTGNELKKVVPGPIENGEGPSVFSARMHGRKGHIILINSAISPCIAFAYTKPRRSLAAVLPGIHNAEELSASDIHPQFIMGLADIVALRKVGGFGWKGKMIVGWALGREVVDGLEIMDKEGRAVVLTAIRGRDELFNRLIAVGEHKWECW
ncbi:hypothetical protein BXZ70DRAFT_1065633 [Cristinia sonorae]|uniref:Uncharacterized protein n=1 Tax=Cristinia sonorae TaxID=1940300 RepID=A0A8K0UM82_9AGAR|nr:hypothetical protein BXZ70DRAFT_1065633 [Cristinia sonorae]